MKFTIKQNKHYSDPDRWGKKIFDFINLQGYKGFWVKFNDSCLYDLGTSDQKDINKLFGVSSGLHHTNSARFGWRAEGNKIKLSSYCYINEKRKSKDLIDLETNRWYKLTVIIRPGAYIFEVEDEDNLLISSSIGTDQKFYWGYNLWPYFGGNQKAPHDMFIELEDFDPYFQGRI
jgi:hypothetical protein